MLLKEGDKSKEIQKHQKKLARIGYDLVVDGVYGPETKKNVKSFQKNNDLYVDGIIGDNTANKINKVYNNIVSEGNDTPRKKDTERYGIEIDRNHYLDDDEYFHEAYQKRQIFIHFTAGSSRALNTINYWNRDEGRIATSYIIDKNTGKIYEVYDPDHWSFHLGISNTNGRLDKSSIGIELCSYGPLKKKNGLYYAWPSDWSKEVDKDEVYELDEEFRGHKFYEAYSDKQLDSLKGLLSFLIEEYDIPVQYHFTKDWVNYDESIIEENKPGIWTHTNVRKDKQDSYPDNRLIGLLNDLSSDFNC